MSMPTIEDPQTDKFIAVYHGNMSLDAIEELDIAGGEWRNQMIEIWKRDIGNGYISLHKDKNSPEFERFSDFRTVEQLNEMFSKLFHIVMDCNIKDREDEEKDEEDLGNSEESERVAEKEIDEILKEAEEGSVSPCGDNEFRDMVERLFKPGQDILNQLTEEKCEAVHAAIGISGEAGELMDAVKKFVIYGKTLDFENVVEELGDLEFYIEAIRQVFGITREQCLTYTREKLLTSAKARYSKGKYSDKQATDRQDKEEDCPEGKK